MISQTRSSEDAISAYQALGAQMAQTAMVRKLRAVEAEAQAKWAEVSQLSDTIIARLEGERVWLSTSKKPEPKIEVFQIDRLIRLKQTDGQVYVTEIGSFKPAKESGSSRGVYI